MHGTSRAPLFALLVNVSACANAPTGEVEAPVLASSPELEDRESARGAPAVEEEAGRGEEAPATEEEPATVEEAERGVEEPEPEPTSPDQWEEMGLTESRQRACWRIGAPMEGHLLCHDPPALDSARGVFTIRRGAKVVRELPHDSLTNEGAAGTMYDIFSHDGAPVLVLVRCSTLRPGEHAYKPCGVRVSDPAPK